ncbi:MAG: hypothetical protein NTW95_10520 [Candidatus Aminicenantes bacterium]|nr:hypothetical protein [Candidatus Aminicenantes bacterium]
MKKNVFFFKHAFGKGMLAAIIFVFLATPIFSTMIKSETGQCPICEQKNKYSVWMSGGFYHHIHNFYPFMHVSFTSLYYCSNCHFTIFSGDYHEIFGEDSSHVQEKLKVPVAEIKTLLKKLDERFGLRAGSLLTESQKIEYLIEICRPFYKNYKFLVEEIGEQFFLQLVNFTLAYRCAIEGRRERAVIAADAALVSLTSSLNRLSQRSHDDYFNYQKLSTLLNIAIMHYCADRDGRALAAYHKLLRGLPYLKITEDLEFKSDTWMVGGCLAVQNFVTTDVLYIITDKLHSKNRSLTIPVRLYGIYLLVLSSLHISETMFLLFVLCWALVFLSVFYLLRQTLAAEKVARPIFSILAFWGCALLTALIIFVFQHFIISWATILPVLFVEVMVLFIALCLVLIYWSIRFFLRKIIHIPDVLHPLLPKLALLVGGLLIVLSIFISWRFIASSAVAVTVLLVDMFWVAIIIAAGKSNGKMLLSEKKFSESFLPWHILRLGVIFFPIAYFLVQGFIYWWGSTITFIFMTILWLGLTLAAEKVFSGFAFTQYGALFCTPVWYFLRAGIVFTPFVFGLTQWPQDSFSWLWNLQYRFNLNLDQNIQQIKSVWHHIILWPYYGFGGDEIPAPALHLLLSLAALALILFLLIVLYKRLKLFRRPLFLLLAALLFEYGLGRLAANGFPPLFYIVLAIVWFFFLLVLEYVFIRAAPWATGDVGWAKQLIGNRSWKYLRVLIALSPLLIGPLSAPGGNLFLKELLTKVF